jgi:hypothetical protein
MNAMNDELPRIQEQVYYGHIQSPTDILDKFLSESSYKRYNPSVSIKISVKCSTLIFNQLIMTPTPFRLLERMQGKRYLFHYLHLIIRKTLYLMELTTYSLLEVCFLLLFSYLIIHHQKIFPLTYGF